jgi:uncharacterized protein (DUF927 family)
MKSNSPPGQINYIIDDNHVVWMEASWLDDQASIEKFATLLYEIHSGELLEDTLRFLKEECNKQGSQKLYQKILVTMNKMFLPDDALEEVAENSEKDTPVVSPTEVALNYLSMF